MKTKLLLLLLTVLSAHVLFASAWDDEGKFKRVYFGLGITPNVTYRYLHQNFVPAGDNSSQVQDLITSRNKYEYPGVGVGGGLKVGIRLTHWLAIESGALFNYQWYRYSNNSPAMFPGWTPSSSLPTDSFLSRDLERYLYFNIPLALNFTAGKHRVKGIFSLGTTFDFLIRHTMHYTYTYNNGTQSSGVVRDTYNDFSSFNLSPFLGIGMDCYITHALVLRIMPIAQMQAFKNINTPITEYLYYGGINVSLLLGFLNGGK